MLFHSEVEPLTGLFGKIISGKNVGDVILGKIINKGGFGVVYHARRLYPAGSRSTHSARDITRFAVKVTRRSDALLYNEVQHQCAVSGHLNVVSIYDVVERTECLANGEREELVFMILDFLDGGDLYDAIEAGSVDIDGEEHFFWRNDELIRHIFVQVLDGIIHCHNKDVFHRDIKPENVLLSGNLKRVCITDFGLATSDRMSDHHRIGSQEFLAPGERVSLSSSSSNKGRQLNLYVKPQNVMTNLNVTFHLSRTPGRLVSSFSNYLPVAFLPGPLPNVRSHQAARSLHPRSLEEKNTMLHRNGIIGHWTVNTLHSWLRQPTSLINIRSRPALTQY
jgi:serine/threonine protein kinase